LSAAVAEFWISGSPPVHYPYQTSIKTLTKEKRISQLYSVLLVFEIANMAGASDKARFYMEQAVPQLREFEDKKIFSKVRRTTTFLLSIDGIYELRRL
jgi:hypothetical protein